MTITPVLWVNGERCALETRHIAANDRGLTLSDGVFETMRARDGVVFRLERHLARLSQALRRLSIPEPAALRDWVLGAVAEAHHVDDARGHGHGDVTRSARHALAQQGSGQQGSSQQQSSTQQRGSALQNAGSQDPVLQPLAEASIRLTVTRGPGPGGLTPPRDPRPTVIVNVNPMPRFPESTYDNGLSAVVATGRRNERAESIGLKTLAYTDGILALLAAHRAGADEALFLDTDGHCSEATASNLFVWTGEALLTPPDSCGPLPGITRATVIELAATLGIAVVDRAFGIDVLLAAQEAFLTSSLRGIAPLVHLDTSAIGNGRPGPVTRRIASAYAALVGHECHLPRPARA